MRQLILEEQSVGALFFCFLGFKVLGESEPFFRLLFAIQSRKHHKADSSLTEPIILHSCAHPKTFHIVRVLNSIISEQ